MAKSKIKIVNRQADEFHNQEIVRMDKQHDDNKKEHAEKKPKPLDLTLLPEDSEPLVLPSGATVVPGMYYGVDDNGYDLVIHPDDIGPEKFWAEV